MSDTHGEIKKAERFGSAMKKLAPITTLLLILFSYHALSVSDVVNAEKAGISGVEFFVKKRIVLLHAGYTGAVGTIVEGVYLKNDAEAIVNGKKVLLPKGTELGYGLERLLLVVPLVPITAGTVYGAIVTDNVYTRRD